jgi:hypothetical protein
LGLSKNIMETKVIGSKEYLPPGEGIFDFECKIVGKPK